MLKSYMVIAVRTLLKRKVFTCINILGLAIGISASLVIYLLASYHFSFDKFEVDRDRIYRVVSNFNSSDQLYHNSGVCDPMPAAVKREVTGLDVITPFRTWNGNPKVNVPNAGSKDATVFKNQKNFVFADSNYFNLVNYTWLSGSPKISLNKPYNTVLTESYARLYFPDLALQDIVGKEIWLDDSIRATILGIVKDIPRNTEFTFKAFMAYSTLENTSLKPENWNQWTSTNGAQQLFVKLAANTTIANTEKQIAQLYNKYNIKKPGDNSKTWHTLQPLNDLHFNADYGNYGAPMGHKPTLYGLLTVGVFLLLLGCINFINLTTAYTAQRSKEIGIRKTMGSSRKQLIIQFLSETFLLAVISTVLSAILTPLILKAFSGFIPEGLHFNLLEQPGILLFLLLLVLSVTILSGFYPALILSGYKPVLVLKNQAYGNTGKTRTTWLRKSLTVSQFTIAQFFIMVTILVSKQITFSLNKDLGFKKEGIVYLQTNDYDTVKTRKLVLLNKLKAIPEIAMVSLSSNIPSSTSFWSETAKFKDGKKEIETDVQLKFGDTNYIRLYHLNLVAGSNYAQTDTVKSILINETYSRILGFSDPQQVVGKYLELNDKQIPISGVIADFHQGSLHEPIKPLVIGSWANVAAYINIALQPQLPGSNTWNNAFGKIEKVWKEVYSGNDFSYTFLDKEIEKFYEGEQHISTLLKWTSALALFISCLGLLGLVIYTTTQRTKEIGVRKALGATVTNIVTIITKEFMLLMVLAFFIATPLGWIAMHKWLQNFEYRTQVSWWIFIAAGLLMTITAILTLSFQTIKAAMANPVKSLRVE